MILLAGITAAVFGVQATDRFRKGECMRKLFMTWLKSVFALIKETFKSLCGTKDTGGRVHYIIDADNLNYIKEKCAEEGIPVSEILLNAIKKGYKIDVKIKSEVLEIFQKEGLVPVILI